MEVRIGQVHSRVTATDSRSAISPQQLDQIVDAVLERLSALDRVADADQDRRIMPREDEIS